MTKKAAADAAKASETSGTAETGAPATVDAPAVKPKRATKKLVAAATTVADPADTDTATAVIAKTEAGDQEGSGRQCLRGGGVVDRGGEGRRAAARPGSDLRRVPDGPSEARTHAIVRTPAGDVVADASGRAAGRGAYVCRTGDCLDKAITKGALCPGAQDPAPGRPARGARREPDEDLNTTIEGGARGQE